MRKTFIETLFSLGADDPSLYVVSGDAGFGVFEAWRERFPARYVNAGVAEANMIGFAAGLALTGWRPFVYNIIPFVLYRCYEQVRNDICYQRLPVTLLGIGSGLTYAPGGMTHYSVEDLTLCLSLPNLTVISPTDPVETEAAVRFAARHDGPVYIRVAKAGEPKLRSDGCPDILAPALLRGGERVAVVGHGSLVSEAAAALDELSAEGIRPALISVPTLSPYPAQALETLLAGFDRVLVVEEHQQSGGLFTRMCQQEMLAGTGRRIIPACLPDAFLHEVRNQVGYRALYGLDASGLAARIRTLWQG